MTPEDIKQRFPGLEQAADEDLQRLLDAASTSDIAAGVDIIAPGTENSTLYLIYTGVVRVSLESGDECTILGEYGPGQWIGEMGMIEPAITVARVTAIQDCTVLALSSDDFAVLRRQCPTFTSILLQLFSNDLAKRLRTTIQFIDGTEADERIGHRWYAEVAKRVLGVAARIGA